MNNWTIDNEGDAVYATDEEKRWLIKSKKRVEGDFGDENTIKLRATKATVDENNVDVKHPIGVSSFRQIIKDIPNTDPLMANKTLKYLKRKAYNETDRKFLETFYSLKESNGKDIALLNSYKPLETTDLVSIDDVPEPTALKSAFPRYNTREGLGAIAGAGADLLSLPGRLAYSTAGKALGKGNFGDIMQETGMGTPEDPLGAILADPLLPVTGLGGGLVKKGLVKAGAELAPWLTRSLTGLGEGLVAGGVSASDVGEIDNLTPLVAGVTGGALGALSPTTLKAEQAALRDFQTVAKPSRALQNAPATSKALEKQNLLPLLREAKGQPFDEYIGGKITNTSDVFNKSIDDLGTASIVTKDGGINPLYNDFMSRVMSKINSTDMGGDTRDAIINKIKNKDIIREFANDPSFVAPKTDVGGVKIRLPFKGYSSGVDFAGDTKNIGSADRIRTFMGYDDLTNRWSTDAGGYAKQNPELGDEAIASKIARDAFRELKQDLLKNTYNVDEIIARDIAETRAKGEPIKFGASVDGKLFEELKYPRLLSEFGATGKPSKSYLDATADYAKYKPYEDIIDYSEGRTANNYTKGLTEILDRGQLLANVAESVKPNRLGTLDKYMTKKPSYKSVTQLADYAQNPIGLGDLKRLLPLPLSTKDVPYSARAILGYGTPAFDLIKEEYNNK